MARRVVLAVIAGVIIGLAVAWFMLGAVNGPSRPPPRDQWEALLGERIKVPEGYQFEVFARDLGTPRMMQMTGDGDLIVSGYQNGNIILLKRDGDGDGRSDGRIVLRENMQLPHGLVLEGGTLFVAEEQRVVKYDFDGQTLKNERVVLDGLPEGGGHSSRTLARGPDGFLYLAIGSSCNSCLEDHPWRAALLRFKEGAAPEIFAAGLRNTVGFDWQPGTGALYGVDNGRDNLGDDVPDDEVNRIEEGKHYGWPYVHGKGVGRSAAQCAGRPRSGAARPWPRRPCGAAVDCVSGGTDTALVAEHGSWNRTEKAGYRIVQLTFDAGGISETVFLVGLPAGRRGDLPPRRDPRSARRQSVRDR